MEIDLLLILQKTTSQVLNNYYTKSRIDKQAQINTQNDTHNVNMFLIQVSSMGSCSSPMRTVELNMSPLYYDIMHISQLHTVLLYEAI